MLAHSSMFPSGALPTYWRSSPAPRPALWCVRMLSGEENERVFEGMFHQMAMTGECNMLLL